MVTDESLLYNLSLASQKMGYISGCVASASAKFTGYDTNKYLGHVLLAPSLTKNIILVARLTDEGFDVSFTGTKCIARKIEEDSELIIEGIKRNGH